MGSSEKKRQVSGKGTRAPTDFKRLKGKVGKRGTKAPNETDTAFQKTSLHVAGQSIQARSSEAILSARGKSIVELSAGTSHPSGAARHSAIKGFINVVKENSVTKLRAHLYILLQTASKALVDEEHDVRASGCVLLEEILARYERSTLAPFLSLLVAYTSSALHSIDPEMRFDGAKVVDRLCSFFHSMISDYVFSLLPPFVNLLSDRNKSNELLSLLGSLVAILSSLSSNSMCCSHDSSFNQDKQQNGFIFLAGGRSTNTFIQQKKRNVHLSDAFDSLGDVVATSELSGVDSKQLLTQDSSLQVLREIQTKLCDLLIEMVQEDDGELCTARKSKFSLNETKATAMSIYLVSSAQVSDKDSKQKELIFTRTAKLLMELFPVINDVPRGSDAMDDPDSVNAWITRAVLVLVLSSGIPERMEESNVYIGRLVAHWIDGASAGKTSNSISATRVDMVVELLQALSSQGMDFSSLRNKIHNELHRNFFDEPTSAVARSLAGRKAAALLAEECLKHNSQQGQDRSDEQILVNSVSSLPFYLKAWSADFQDESYLIVDALRWMACRKLKSDNDATLDELRENLTIILTKQTALTSIFEQYPLKLQRSFLGLIRMLGHPTKSVLKALAATCASAKNSSNGDENVGHEVFASVCLIQKTISMSDFLAFVISSTGVPRNLPEGSGSSTLDELGDYLLLFDARVSRGSKAVIECGSVRALHMLMPQLLSWVNSGTPNFPTMTSVLRDRASICMLSMLLVDIDHTDVIYFETMPGLSDLLHLYIQAGKNVVLFLSKKVALRPHLEKLLAPFAVLSGLHLTLARDLTKMQTDMIIQAQCDTDDDRARLSDVLDRFGNLLDIR